MSTSSDSAGIDLSEVFAPIYWGFIVSLLLGGITIVQAYIYFPAPKDSAVVRWTAVAMIILDLTSSALLAQSVYYYLIPHFGSLSPFGSVTPEISAECLISGVITFLSQLYFVHQLYAVKQIGIISWITVICLFTVLAFVAGIACVAAMYVFHHGVLSNRNKFFAIFFGLAKGSGAIADILATIAMCIFLTSAKTGMSETNVLINKLMRFVIHRGALVTLIQTLLLITFYAAPSNLYWMAFHINVTKLYANTFFAMLNGRQHLKAKLSHSVISRSFASTRSHTQDKRNFRSEDYNPSHTERDLEGFNLYNMPTVTKTVVIADM
jgi:hypothetical protein